MDYKNTLNLPQTGFPMKADLVTREPERLKKWESAGLYQKIQAARAGAPKFVLHDGPPFANGDVHIGTALNKTLKDIIVKYHSLRGKSAPYVPGWDCHGLPIEFKVSQDMRKEFEANWPEERKKHEDLWKDKTDPAAVELGIKTMSLSQFMSAKEIRERCDAYARRYIDIQRTQFKRLGVLGDWDNPYLTLNKEYEAEELRLFADIVEKGFVYRGKKPVYWSIPCRTALAEAEVEYHDHVSQSIYVKFKVFQVPEFVQGSEFIEKVSPSNVFVLIWTTTPWTLPANLAVAFNPKLQYSLVQVGDEQYLILSSLVSSAAEKCKWEKYEMLATILGSDLEGLEYQHPFCNRTGEAFPADFVTSDTGTGFVHIAPGHGLDDYNLGRQHGLPIYSPVDNDGCFVWTEDLPYDQQMPQDMLGKSILEKHGKSDANETVLHELRMRHALLHQENYHHSYPFCWRSKTAIIFRAMDQWFIKVDHVPPDDAFAWMERISKIWGFLSPTVANIQSDIDLVNPTLRKLAIAEIDWIEHNKGWIPDWGGNRIRGAVQSRPDWVISRQRSWGLPIPAFFDGKNWILDPKIIRKFADLFEETGSQVWFSTEDARKLLVAAKAKELVPPGAWTDALKKSNDTLDVWIDSGSSSRAVLMRRPELSHATGTHKSALDWQADVYLEGSDQHRGWFQSSLLLSLAGNGAPPFKTVLTHGFMVDADREKISKSKQAQGGYEKPQTSEAYIKKYGADVVRLWVASQDYRNDIVVSEERLKKVTETYGKLRNTLRYQISNLYDFDPVKHTVPDDKLTSIDRWILSKFTTLEHAVTKAYDLFEFHGVYQLLRQFASVELSAIYHDVIKDRLYTDSANSHRRRSTQTTLNRLVTSLCKMLSPILVFTTDEAWEFVSGKDRISVHESEFEPTKFIVSQVEERKWEKLFDLREQLLPKLELKRKEKIIGKSLDAKVRLYVKEAGPITDLAGDKNLLEEFRELLNVSQFEFTEEYHADLVVHADGQKCERCWHWETDVGSNSEHPTICERCIGAINQK